MKKAKNTAIKAAIAAVALLGSATALAADADLATLEKAAQAEGQATWCNGNMSDTVAQHMINTFQKTHPGVKINGLRATSQVAYQRLLQDMQSGIANCDVYSSSDIGHFEALKADGKLLEYTPIAAKNINPAFESLYDEGWYYPALISTMAIAYRKDALKGDEIPASWKDLLDPKWKNKITIGHPGYSGFVGTWAVMIKDMYGVEYFEDFEKNNPLIGRSGNDPVTQINSGERMVGPVPAYVALASESKGNPIGVAYPSDGALLMVSPVALVKNAPRPNAGKLFMEWLMGEENAEIMVAEGGEPLPLNAKLPEGRKPISEIKTVRPATDRILKGIPEVVEDWRDTFGN